MKYIILEQDTALSLEDFMKIGGSIIAVKTDGFGADRKFRESREPVSMTVIEETVLVRLKPTADGE